MHKRLGEQLSVGMVVFVVGILWKMDFGLLVFFCLSTSFVRFEPSLSAYGAVPATLVLSSMDLLFMRELTAFLHFLNPGMLHSLSLSISFAMLCSLCGTHLLLCCVLISPWEQATHLLELLFVWCWKHSILHTYHEKSFLSSAKAKIET